MENVLLHAVKDTVFIGGEPEKDAFHIALTGTADYIPHMGGGLHHRASKPGRAHQSCAPRFQSSG